MLFEDFDARGYHNVDVRTGYGERVQHYDDTVHDAMDIALLNQLSTPDWTRTQRAVDLACGTGRTGAWLRQRGTGHIDSVDLTPDMLREAQRRGTHDTLIEADVRDTGLPEDTYDLAVTSLADEHLDGLAPLYREAARITTTAAVCVLVAPAARCPRSLFTASKKNGDVFQNPTSKIRVGARTGRVIQPLTNEHIQRTMAAAVRPADPLILALATIHAARPPAIRALILDDIDIGNRRLTIDSSERPLDETTLRSLRLWLSYRREHWPHP